MGQRYKFTENMKKSFMNIALIFVAVFPIALAAKKPAYIPLARSITPTALFTIRSLNQSTKNLLDQRRKDQPDGTD